MNDLLLFAAGFGVFLLVLVALGVVGNSWDSRERRDARNRNPRAGR
ncbi:MAG TPA: hypothetical protein VGK17_01445 [Propionicimonas sp.]